MVNLKRFFKAITKPNGGSSRGGPAASSSTAASMLSPRAVLSTNENQFNTAHENAFQLASFKSAQRSPSKSDSYSNESSGGDSSQGSSPEKPTAGASSPPNMTAARWGAVLSKIPKLVAEATSAAGALPSGSPSAGAASSLVNGDSAAAAQLAVLLDLLEQMAGREYQQQIMKYYKGSLSSTSSSASSSSDVLPNWEQRKIFKQCRRTLLLCWKFLIAQLNDENTVRAMNSETRDTYCQLIALICERVEFNLHHDPRESATSNNGSNSYGQVYGRGPLGSPMPRHHTKSRTSSQTGGIYASPRAYVPLNTSDEDIYEYALDSAAGNGNATTASSNGGSSTSSERDRDMYLYRCLLVATFKYVSESIDGVLQKTRGYITYSESQFFARILAVCFFRIPVVQRQILDAVFETYRCRTWTRPVGPTMANTSALYSATTPTGVRPVTPNQAATVSRLNRRRSSTKAYGMTFAGSLARWSEFEGQILSEFMDDTGVHYEGRLTKDPDREPLAADFMDRDPASCQVPTPKSSLSSPSKSAVDKFRRQNPTLFRWSRYAPYLDPYADADVFRLHETTPANWLTKLTREGEFFAFFMAAYSAQAHLVCIGDTMIWSALPGYPLLIRVSMLVLKEATWFKWNYVRDLSAGRSSIGAGSNTAYGNNDTSLQDENSRGFLLSNIRGTRTVLNNVPQLLHNHDLLDSCVLALLECTNVLHVKSVDVCLGRLEEWFAAVLELTSTGIDPEPQYRLPASFHGQALATALRIMLGSESFEVLNRTLHFLYARIDYFDGELRQQVLKAVVQRHMGLFLHWNVDVRDCYHHLLVYKIVRVNRYFLDSPIDHLLVGRYSTLPLDDGGQRADHHHHYHHYHHHHHYHDAADHDDEDAGAYDAADKRPVLSTSEFNALRLEQALWRAFDACLAAICVLERKNARTGNRRYQIELQAAQCRAVAFQHLTKRSMHEDDDNRMNPMNEGLPGGKSSHEFDLMHEELHRDPPYYLRYLPAEEVSNLDELRRLASTVRYPLELQVYAAISLRHYSDLLKKYFSELRTTGVAEPPPLGFC